MGTNSLIEPQKATVIMDPAAVVAAMAKHDTKYSELFQRLEELTEGLENFSTPVQERYNIIASVEFLAIRIQILIKVEKDRLDNLISFKDSYNQSILTKLVSRKNKLIEKEKNIEDIINSFKATAYIVYNTKQY